MKQNFTQKLIQLGLIVFLLSFSLNGYTQNTFTVVCDKTDHTVKVVESDKRSPNFVPIKGGFPFRQVAQKWIDENYTTTQCDPGEILNDIKTQTQNQDTGNNSVSPAPPQNTISPAPPSRQNRTFQPAVTYRNSSFILGIKFSNLGDALNLDQNIVPGFEVGLEQLFGTKIYFGTGILFDMYFAEDENFNNSDPLGLYFGRIPAFVGYRMERNNISVMYETGVQVNTRIVSTEDDKHIPYYTASDNTVNFLARVKVGTETFLLEIGSELWLSELFENEDFDMTSLYLGLRFYF